MPKPVFSLVHVPAPAPVQPRVPIGAATLENADRAAYQSARSIGFVAPLPLTEAQAWAEAAALRPDLFGDCNE